MSKLNVVGRAFSSGTVATKDENGDWKVIVDMVEKRLVEGLEWEEKKVSAMCTNKTFQDAYGTAMESTLKQFQDATLATGSDSLFPKEEEDEPLIEEGNLEAPVEEKKKNKKVK